MDKRIIEETPSSEVLNDDWFVKDSPTGGTSKILGSDLKDTFTGDVEDAIDKILSSIAPEWSSTITYGYDAYVIYEGELWRCFKDTGSTVGEFKTSEWIKGITSGYISLVIDKIANRFVASNPPYMTYRYSVGDMVFYSEPYHDEQLYVCNTDLPQGESTFNPEHWDVVYTVAGLSKYLMDKIAEAGQIDDVQVKTTGDYESVVDENKVAKIDLSNILIEKSVPNLPQPIATFNDGSDLPLKSLTASIEPVQDLHGYDHPWAGGAGKNKLPLTVDGIKSLNTEGTWNEYSYTVSGVTFTIQTDNDGNVIGIKANGTATANASLYLAYPYTANFDCILNGCPENGSGSTYQIAVTGVGTERGSGLNISNGESGNLYLRVFSDYTANNLIFKPMIRLATVSDATFEPYSNICPISGWTGANVYNYGKNLLDMTKIITSGSYNSDNTVFSTGDSNIPTARPVVAFSPIDTTVIVSCGTVSGTCITPTIRMMDSNNQTVDVWRLTSNSTATFTGVSKMQVDYGRNGTLTVNEPMIRFSTVSDSTYEPIRNPITYTIPFTDSQGNPVEVYGGSVDVVNGTSGNEKTLGKFILDENSTIYTGSSGMPFRISIADIKRSTSESSLLGLLSNQMKEVTQSDTWGDECTMSVITNSDRIFFKLTNDITTVEDLKTYLEQHPIEIVYPLATPTTFYTQPTAVKSLDGVNNVFASTGDVTKLDYIANATDVIANLEARVTALENA